MFFDFKKTPNIKAALKAELDPEEFTLAYPPPPPRRADVQRRAAIRSTRPPGDGLARSMAT
jgi:hypothetical protein